MGYADGTVELINFTTHKLFTRLDLRNTYKTVIPPKDDSIKCNYEITIPQLSATCLRYSPSGIYPFCSTDTYATFREEQVRVNTYVFQDYI